MLFCLKLAGNKSAPGSAAILLTYPFLFLIFVVKAAAAVHPRRLHISDHLQ